MIMDETAWLAVCFTIFIVLAFKPTKKAIFAFLDGKIKEIKDALNDAQNAKIEAEEEFKALEQDIEKTDDRHKEMIAKATSELEAFYKARCAELQESIAFREQAAKGSLSQMKVDAASKVEGAFLELVVNAVTDHMQKNASGKMDVNILKKAS